MGSAILQWPFSRFWQQFPTRIRRNGRRRKNTQRTRGKQLLINFKKLSQIVLKLSPELSQKLSLMSLKLSSKNSTKFDWMEKDKWIPNELKTFKLFGLVLTHPRSSKVFITNHIPRCKLGDLTLFFSTFPNPINLRFSEKATKIWLNRP